MRVAVRFILSAFLCLCVFTGIACRHSSTDDPARSKNSPEDVSATVFDETQESPEEAAGENSDLSAAPEETGPDQEMKRPTRGKFLGLDEMVSVQSILDRMISAYQNARTYRDLGELVLHWKQNGKLHERRTAYRTNFQRPNGLLLEVGPMQILANGKLLCAYTPEMPGLILQKPCPKELSLFDFLSEPEIFWSLTEVESSRFCNLPPPLIFLMCPDPLATFLYQGDPNAQAQLALLDSGKIGENECFRISIQKKDEESIFWIDSQTFILRRVELPAQIIQKDEKDPENEEEMMLTLEFNGAEFDWVGVLAMNVPERAVPVASFTAPQIGILGTKFPKCQFRGLDAQAPASYDYQNKTLFCFFWSVYTTNPFKFQDLERLYRQFSGKPNFVFLGVNIDPPSVSNEKVLAAAAKFGLTCPVVRNSDEVITQMLQNGEVFSCFLVDSRGIIQFCDGLSSFRPALHYARKIQAVLNGKEIYKDLIREIETNEETFRASIRQWVENGIFLKEADFNPITISEKKILPASEPVLCQKKTLWATAELKSPTWIQPFQPKKSILVLESGKGVAEVDQAGKIVERHALELPEDEFLTKIRVYTPEETGKTSFVLLGKRFYVYDSDWKLQTVYPPESPEAPKRTISDAIVGDWDADGKPEIYAAFQNETGILKLTLQGEELGKSETESNVLQLAAAQIQGKLRVLSVDQSGRIAVYEPQSLECEKTLEIPRRTLNSLAACDSIEDEAETDFLAATAISPNGNIRALGFSDEGEESWNIDLPDYLYQRNIPKVLPFFCLDENELERGWVLLGADSSVFLVEPDGLLIDQFHFGKIITGCAAAVFDETPILFIASPDGVCALEFQRN